MLIDTKLARLQTPGCQHVLHFNNAGAALAPQTVLDAVVSHLMLEARIGSYEATEHASEALEGVYSAAAKLIRCSPREVAVVENATAAWDLVFFSLKFQPRDEILTGMSEYSSNYIAMLHGARRTGAVVRIVPNNEHGELSIEALQSMISERVKLIAVAHVPANSGLVNPVARIGEVAKRSKIFYLLDACQSVGQMPVDVNEIGCDALSATGRKYLRGPRGTGFLYVRRERMAELDPPFVDFHSGILLPDEQYAFRPDARRFESWESNQAAKIGLGTAIEYALSWEIDAIKERVFGLAARLRSQLARLPRVQVRDTGRVRCGIVTFTYDRMDAQDVRRALLERNINVSVAGPLSSPLDMQARGIDALVRASVHYYNTDDEIEKFCDALNSLRSR